MDRIADVLTALAVALLVFICALVAFSPPKACVECKKRGASRESDAMPPQGANP